MPSRLSPPVLKVKPKARLNTIIFWAKAKG